MYKISLFILSFFSVCSLSASDIVELTSQDGRSMRASIDNYFPETEEVSVRVNGQGARIRFSMERLDAASQKTVKQWYRAYVVDRLLRFEIERVPGDRGTCYYEIEITNSSNIEVSGLRAEYLIPMKLKSQVAEAQKQNSGAGKKGKSKIQKVKYKTVQAPTVKSGKIEIPSVPARGQLVVETSSVVSETEQVVSTGSAKGKGKGKAQGQSNSKKVTNRNSIQGILLRVYSGNTLLKTVESKHGIAQLVEKARN